MVFNALGGADDDLAGVEMGADAGEGGAEKLGGDDGDDDLSIGDGGFAAGDGDFAGDGEAGEEEGLRILIELTAKCAIGHLQGRMNDVQHGRL